MDAAGDYIVGRTKGSAGSRIKRVPGFSFFQFCRRESKALRDDGLTKFLARQRPPPQQFPREDFDSSPVNSILNEIPGPKVHQVIIGGEYIGTGFAEK